MDQSFHSINSKNIVWRSWFIENDSFSSLDLALSSHLQFLQNGLDFISEISGESRFMNREIVKRDRIMGEGNDFTIKEIAKTATVYWLFSIVVASALLQRFVLDGGYQFFTHANFNWIGESKRKNHLNEYIAFIWILQITYSFEKKWFQSVAINFTNIFSNFQVCIRLNNHLIVIKKYLLIACQA